MQSEKGKLVLIEVRCKCSHERTASFIISAAKKKMFIFFAFSYNRFDEKYCRKIYMFYFSFKSVIFHIHVYNKYNNSHISFLRQIVKEISTCSYFLLFHPNKAILCNCKNQFFAYTINYFFYSNYCNSLDSIDHFLTK